MDSSSIEIYNKLVMIENKIVTLTNSYSEMSQMKSGPSNSNEPQFNAAKYKKHYMKLWLANLRLRLFPLGSRVKLLKFMNSQNLLLKKQSQKEEK